MSRSNSGSSNGMVPPYRGRVAPVNLVLQVLRYTVSERFVRGQVNATVRAHTHGAVVAAPEPSHLPRRDPSLETCHWPSNGGWGTNCVVTVPSWSANTLPLQTPPPAGL